MTRLHRPLVYSSVIMAVVAVVSLAGLLLDDRMLDGMPVWAKPLKFAVSFGLYTLTWAWLLSLRRRAPRAGRRLGTVLAVAGTAEVLLITAQAARGRRSHFNFATPLDSALYSIMGLTVVILMIANIAAAVLVLRERQGDPAQTWAIRLGLVISTVGIGLGYLMTVPTAAQLADVAGTVIGAHSVGVPDGGPGLPLAGWSTVGGDLRVPHFVGMHAIQVLPLVVMALAPLRGETVRLRLVFVAGGGYAGLVALVTWQALRAQPLLRPDAATLVAAAALLAGVAVATLLSFRLPAGAPPAGRPAAQTSAGVLAAQTPGGNLTAQPPGEGPAAERLPA
ncbi:hypothetical protein FHS43_004198 [Streptosporangium becharense]|uniref:Uncharacterized protein n=1 Tax=Streptosporangium becharense TaxID=1816182 RepID=A0A7W9ICP7_9ACTN|nr:hypothetical protein [Streptosporangium becharense]MBB2912903.1 hypothetical protein [Streptosporangium becharense]MBB5818272.1 hypothetical protein [Streptosporangium becharense]